MKKTLKMAVAASVLTAPAMAANLENPLYLPSQGEIFSKTSAGIMIKKADSSDAHVAKGHDGAIEFPIWRFQQDIGYGITDRLAVHGSFGYTKDGDIDRKGLHLGRVGMTYRVLDSYDDFIWDLYADAHLGGVGKMKGALTDTGFKYDNYSNGRWGFHVGTKFGKTWNKWTTAAFVEVLHTFGNDNNEIDVTQATAMGMPLTGAPFFFPNSISVNLKSTTEINAGLKAFYEFSDRWSMGGGFTYKHHADNGIESLSDPSFDSLNPAAQGVATAMLAAMENMEDGFDEYILGITVANQLTDSTQVALYGEYTFDTAHPQSQNGTDLKAEVGVRLNVTF